jgi:hypothetical protein
MSFLRDCNERLKRGESAASILRDIYEQYSTVQSRSSKVSILRNMYDGEENDEFVDALGDLQVDYPDIELRQFCKMRLSDGMDLQRATEIDPELSLRLAALPSRLPQNVRDVHVTREEARECKNLKFRTRARTVMKKQYIDGRGMLAWARRVVEDVDSRQYELMMALLLLTGRRMCEICNGKSALEHGATPYTVSFTGQAKRKGKGGTFPIPVLHGATFVMTAIERLRQLQGDIPTTNEAVSSKYASGLRHFLQDHTLLRHTGRVHNLRKIYTCMALRIFDWEDLGDLYVAMKILGQGDVTEPIVYNVFDVGSLEGEYLGKGVIE